MWLTERGCRARCNATDLAAPQPSALATSPSIWPSSTEWRQVDATTWYVEHRHLDGHKRPTYEEQMTHFWRHGVAQAVGPAGSAPVINAIINDVRAATVPA